MSPNNNATKGQSLSSTDTGELSVFLQNILESSTEYSIIGKDLEGNILLWNEGAKRIYGYDVDEVVGKANSSILHTPEDLKSGKPAEIMSLALKHGKWEGTINRLRKDKSHFTARIVITPRYNSSGKPVGFLLISKDISDETRLIEELKNTQAFLQNILESSTEYSVIGKDLEGNILLWNEGAKRLYGYDVNEVVGKANSSILHTPEDVQSGKPAEITTLALKNGKWEGTLNRLRKDGSRFIARVVMTPRYDPSGKPIGFLLISKDISDEIRLIEELKNTQFYARSLIEASLDPLVTISPEGKITDVNEATAQITGCTKEELIGSDFSNYFTEPEKAREGYQQVFSKGRVTDYSLTIRHKSGKLSDVLYNASVYKNEKGNVLGVFAAARDVTLTKQASQYARSLIEASLDPLVTISLEGKITDVNDATIKVTGVPRESLIGTDFSNYFTEPEKAREGYQQVFKKGFVTDYALTIRSTSGKLTDVLYNASVYKDDKGNVLGVFAAARDVTDTKQASQYARSLIEASLDPLVTISLEGKITDVNQTTVNITGISREKLIGTDFSDYFTEPGKAREGYQEVFKKGFVTDYALTIRSTSGKLTDVLYNASVYKDDKGNVLGVFAAARDITVQKLASQYSRSLIEASLDPLVTISPEGKITDVNLATIEVTGIPQEKLIGSDFSDYFTEPEEARQGYQLVFKEGIVRDYPLAIKHSSGKVTHVLYNATVYKDPEGKVQGVFAAARDITERKKVEEQLHTTSAYARSLIESSLDPLVTISPEGKITDVNHAFELITGVSREWLIGADFANYFTEPRKARQGYRKAFEEGAVRDYPLTITQASGKEIEVSYNATVYKDAVGKPRGVFAAARDITETKQAAQYARSLIEASLDPLVTISPEGKITDVNATTIQVTGCTREELIGSDFSDYFTEPEKARVGYRQVFSKGRVVDYPLTIRHKEGKLTDVLYNASVYKDDKGNVLGVFAAARDVTETKKTSVYSRSLIEASLDPLVTISPEGKITDVNDATIKVTGVPRESLIGTDFSNYFTEPGKASEGYQEVFKKGFVTDYPLTIRSTTGKLTDVLYNASVYKDEKGNVLGVFAAARDYSRVKQTTHQLEVSNKELEAFSYSISHDLRAPIRAIDSFSKILREEYSDKLDDEGKRVIKTILDNTLKMGKLIDSLLEFSRLGRQAITLENIDMTTTVKELFEELKSSCPERSVDLKVNKLLDAKVDPSLFRQVWINLLSNAIKFTGKNNLGIVEVGSKVEQGYNTYWVKDNGAGFEMKYIDKLFGVFQRLHDQKDFEGTGVGLATAQRIVSRHGGKIWANSKVNEGATFYFTLPSK